MPFRTKLIEMKTNWMPETAEIVLNPRTDRVKAIDLAATKRFGIEGAVASYTIKRDGEVLWQGNLIESSTYTASKILRFKQPIAAERLEIEVRNLGGTPPYNLTWFVEIE